VLASSGIGVGGAGFACVWLAVAADVDDSLLAIVDDTYVAIYL